MIENAGTESATSAAKKPSVAVSLALGVYRVRDRERERENSGYNFSAAMISYSSSADAIRAEIIAISFTNYYCGMRLISIVSSTGSCLQAVAMLLASLETPL